MRIPRLNVFMGQNEKALLQVGRQKTESVDGLDHLRCPVPETVQTAQSGAE
jgi:hypothetical protein